MQIQKLEDEYDVVLFDRSRKPIVPTDIGAALLPQFRRVLDEFSRIEQIAGELAGSGSTQKDGPLRHRQRQLYLVHAKCTPGAPYLGGRSNDFTTRTSQGLGFTEA